MKALTLTQPWATLVAIGAKTIETRSWWSSYRGPIAIHAAKGFPATARYTCGLDPFAAVLDAAGYPSHTRLPLGAIIATATLHQCQQFTAQHGASIRSGIGTRYPEHELEFGDFTPGRYGFWLRDVVKLDEPITARGMLNLWPVPDAIATQLQAEALR